jgi:hypothetical protein
MSIHDGGPTATARVTDREQERFSSVCVVHHPLWSIAMTVAKRSAAHYSSAWRLLGLAGMMCLACTGTGTTPGGTPPRDIELAAPEVPASAPSISGTVTRIVAGDSTVQVGEQRSGSVSCPPECTGVARPLRSVLIEGTPGTGGGGADKSVVTMLAGARVLRRTATGVELAAFSDIHAGQQVAAWFDGPVLNSYPTQAKGAVIVIER